eukprot:1587997-Amphidinium_carterae.1
MELAKAAKLPNDNNAERFWETMTWSPGLGITAATSTKLVSITIDERKRSGQRTKKRQPIPFRTKEKHKVSSCLLYTSPSPRDRG